MMGPMGGRQEVFWGSLVGAPHLREVGPNVELRTGFPLVRATEASSPKPAWPGGGKHCCLSKRPLRLTWTQHMVAGSGMHSEVTAAEPKNCLPGDPWRETEEGPDSRGGLPRTRRAGWLLSSSVLEQLPHHICLQSGHQQTCPSFLDEGISPK
uniref:Uncharacterized protein n=1 Tax=Myotis myotis TaxID=51298 RepID=A0A7J7TTL5_MYOMY|nr:hypothetical protein mMyoMyo1_008927 [Myotis myotis]